MPLLLVVVQGPDVGARLLVPRTMSVVGRARDCDLVLADPSVSRRHFEVRAVDGGLRVRVTGTSPLVVRDREVTEADLALGDRVVVGDTVLRVCEEASTDVQSTDLETLMSGIAADVRGVAALFALVERLDATMSEEDVARVVNDWSTERLEAEAAQIEDANDEAVAPAAPINLVAAWAEESGGCTVQVPAYAAGRRVLRVRFLAPSDRVGDGVRRIIVLAGRLCASRLTQLQMMASARHEKESLRRLAVGSARVFLGTSPGAEHLAKLIPRLAASDATVLLEGETGTGKTFVARLIHESSKRATEQLHVINCAAIPENLLESELFGHERGAFTGALSPRAGAFEVVGNGTLLLDEVGELPLGSQAKLLRALEERRFERVGSSRSLRLHARVLAATNRDLRAMVDEGKFRSDLYYRLAVVTARVPPLRDRGEDVKLLAQHILEDLRQTAGRRVEGFTGEALGAIGRYAWPGNVRELRNAIEHACAMGDHLLIGLEDLPLFVRGTGEEEASADESATIRLPAPLEVLEQRAIAAALRVTGGNRARAAALLGIHRATLHNKLKEVT